MERILLATDGSEHSERAFEVAVLLARKLGASLSILAVAPFRPELAFGSLAGAPPPMPDDEQVSYFTEVATRLKLRAERDGVGAVQVVVKEGDPAEGILTEAAAGSADLVVLGARGVSGARRAILGSVSHAVVTQSMRPVLTVRGATAAAPGPAGPERIVAATDGSPPAGRAVTIAIDIGRALGLGLRLVSVVPGTGGLGFRPDRERAIQEMLEKDAAALLERDRERAQRAGVPEVGVDVLHGTPADTVLEYAGDSPRTLLVAGSRGRSRARRLLLGSVSSALLHHARGMVLIVPPAPHRPRRAARPAPPTAP